MSGPGLPPVFLERHSYRRRRIMDALRILPMVGMLLWLFPLFWPTGPEGPGAPDPMMLSDAVTYVFAVWLILIGSALALWWALRPGIDAGEDARPRNKS